MKATCSLSPDRHKRFITVAAVTQDWVVDETGEFIELPDDRDEQVLHRPDPDNIWTCAVCGAPAKAER